MSVPRPRKWVVWMLVFRLRGGRRWLLCGLGEQRARASTARHERLPASSSSNLVVWDLLLTRVEEGKRRGGTLWWLSISSEAEPWSAIADEVSIRPHQLQGILRHF